MPLISVVYTFSPLSHSKVIFFAMNILIHQKSDTLLNKTICIDVHVQHATHSFNSPARPLSYLFHCMSHRYKPFCQSVAFDRHFKDKMLMSGLKYKHNSEKNMAAIHETCNPKGEPYLCHSV